jgi:manganese efflux pump family protein
MARFFSSAPVPYGARVIGLFVAAVAVGLGNFAASIGIGLSGVDNRTRLRIGVVFGFFEAAMPVLGLLAGQSIAGPMGHIGHYVGAGLLVLTGGYILWKARSGGEASILEVEDLKRNRLTPSRLLVMGLALSLDNLVVGFALSLYDVSLAIAALVIGVVSVAMSLGGLELGQRLGRRFEEWSEELSGAVLILVGVALGSGVMQ